MAQLTFPAARDFGLSGALKPKHKVFLSHSGAQKAFVEHLCMELEGCFRFPFFDKRRDSLPIGEKFPKHIFDAIRQCDVGVVILSEEFLTSKWPMTELVAMVEEVEKRSSFKIIPVFFRTSIKEFDDITNRTRWQSRWQELALEKKNRVVVEKCEAALTYLRSINGLVYDGLDELRFQRVVVDAVCGAVPSQIRFEDSYIQGRSRMCKEIQEKIDILQKDNIPGVCVIGLYGMGGIGKTSICKALCNEFLTKFRGKVCHAELERVTEEELLREVVKKLSNTSHDRLDGFHINELQNGLKEGIIKEAVFLALDNMSDSAASIMEAKSYLSARLPPGSIVMVTARSMDSLMRVRPYLKDNKCMQMPELDIEEARSLFIKSSDFEWRNKDDEELIERCVQRCRFLKDDSGASYHYHPLALDVLGRQLGFVDQEEWKAQLDRIDEDIFNQSKENNHPVFSILRKSFDVLSPEDQLLFMDIAHYLPETPFSWVISRHFEWLGLVHGLPRANDVLIALNRLKRKSLLQGAGDGVESRIGMHDLWRAFCVAETNAGKLKRRRWVYDVGKCSDLVETKPSGSCWENVKRMAFLECESRSLERVNFAHFSNVTVLKISGLGVEKVLAMDLSGLIHLKSLEMSCDDMSKLVVQGLPKGLLALRLESPVYGLKSWPNSQEFVKQIECLKELQYLEVINYGVGKLPNMRSMVSLRVAVVWRCKNVITLTGLCSEMKYLRVVDLTWCSQLRSCPGVEELEDLEELICWGCRSLENLPNLRKLKRLRKLDVSNCSSITGLSGLDELVALEELRARACRQLSKLPDMHKLRNLQVLDLWRCRLEEVPGLDSVISPTEVRVDFQNVVDKPSLGQMTKLQTLDIEGWSSAGLRELPNLVMLQLLYVGCCSVVDELPDLRSLIRLQSLRIWDCEFEDVSVLSNLSGLIRFEIIDCMKLERLPDLRRLPGLEVLMIRGCPLLRGRWDCSFGEMEGRSCMSDDTSDQFDLLGLPRVRNMRELKLANCGFSDLTGIEAFSKLEGLKIESLPVRELPDLSIFPQLKDLILGKLEGLSRLTTREPMSRLSRLWLSDLTNLATVPDLSNYPGLENFVLRKCPAVTTWSFSGPLLRLREVVVSDCCGLNEVPDLGMFPVLRSLSIVRCDAITSLSSCVPLTALQTVHVSGCRGVCREGLDELRALGCPECQVYHDPPDLLYDDVV